MGKNKMFKNEDDFRKIIARLNIDTNPKDEHRETLRANMLSAFKETREQNTRPASHWPVLWRKIMRNSITKLAAAAVIIAVVVLGVTILEKTSKPAWAIENTANAMDKFNAIYISALVSPSLESLRQGFDNEIVDEFAKMIKDGPVQVEFWMQANETKTHSGKVKVQTSTGFIGYTDEVNTYLYNPNNNKVYIQKGCHIMINPWLSGDLLIKLKKSAKDWQVIYGKDGATGKDLAIALLNQPSYSESMQIEIDLETNLPIRYKVWHNIYRQGKPAYDFQRVVYLEELPKDVLDFKIPDGATVIEK
jgi:hypothetical protein